MAKKKTPAVSSGPSHPSTVSIAAARLRPLLAGIRDHLRACMNSAKSIAEDEGVAFYLRAEEVATAIPYLNLLGLPCDAKRLGTEYRECRHLAIEQMMGLANLAVEEPPDGMTKEEFRDWLIELVGPFPPGPLDDLRTRLVGAVGRFLQHVEELTSTVDTMFPAPKLSGVEAHRIEAEAGGAVPATPIQNAMVPFVQVQKILGFTRSELRELIERAKIPTDRPRRRDGKPHSRRLNVDLLATFKAVMSDVAISSDPIRLRKIRAMVQRAEMDKRLQDSVMECFFGETK